MRLVSYDHDLDLSYLLREHLSSGKARYLLRDTDTFCIWHAYLVEPRPLVLQIAVLLYVCAVVAKFSSHRSCCSFCFFTGTRPCGTDQKRMVIWHQLVLSLMVPFSRSRGCSTNTPQNNISPFRAYMGCLRELLFDSVAAYSTTK